MSEQVSGRDAMSKKEQKAAAKIERRQARKEGMRASLFDPATRVGIVGTTNLSGLVEFRKRELPLSIDETADETHAFMESFRPAIENGTAPEVLIVALKAGLPIGLMFKDLWSDYYPDIMRPVVRYIDIGTKQRGSFGSDGGDPSDISSFTIEKSEVATQDAEQVRRTYVRKVKDETSDQYFAVPYKRILCVDDFSQSGETIKSMQETFVTAFPDSEITTCVVYSRIPPWYDGGHSDTDILGIQDWNEERYETLAIQRLNSRHRLDEDYTSLDSYQAIMGSPQKAKLMDEYNLLDAQLRESMTVPATANRDQTRFLEGRKMFAEIEEKVRNIQNQNAD